MVHSEEWLSFFSITPDKNTGEEKLERRMNSQDNKKKKKERKLCESWPEAEVKCSCEQGYPLNSYLRCLFVNSS